MYIHIYKDRERERERERDRERERERESHGYDDASSHGDQAPHLGLLRLCEH